MRTWNADEIEFTLQLYQNELKNDENKTELFSSDFAKWQGSSNAYMFQNGRSALSFILQLLDLKPNHEVIISPYSCVVVYNAVLYASAKPLVCDIELESLSLDFEQLKKKITPNTKAIIIPHIMGFVSRDLIKTANYCKKKNILLIEDCAQAQGAELNGKKVGSFGDAAFFSFEYSKIMSTINGGAAIFNNKLLSHKAQNEYLGISPTPNEYLQKVLALGIKQYYNYVANKKAPISGSEENFRSTLSIELDHLKPGVYGRKMHSAIAELGLMQLKKIDKSIEKRRAKAQKWFKNYDDLISFLKPIKNSNPVYLRLPGYITKKQKADKSIDFGNVKLGYWYSTLLDPADVKLDGLPNSKKACDTIINLPTL